MKLWQWGRSGNKLEVIGEIADEAGKLGIAICDVAGHVEEAAARVKRQAELCGGQNTREFLLQTYRRDMGGGVS